MQMFTFLRVLTLGYFWHENPLREFVYYFFVVDLRAVSARSLYKITNVKKTGLIFARRTIKTIKMEQFSFFKRKPKLKYFKWWFSH